MKKLLFLLASLLCVSLYSQTYDLLTAGNYLSLKTISGGIEQFDSAPTRTTTFYIKGTKVYFTDTNSVGKHIGSYSGYEITEIRNAETLETFTESTILSYLRSHTENSTSIIPTINYNESVSLGKVEGVITWNKFGYNLDIDIGSEEIIAPWGSSFQVMTSAETLTIDSTSAQDDTGGTGATSVMIMGIDENFLEVSETITMDGTSGVTTTNSYLGVNRMIVLSSGSSDFNVGDINATSSTYGIQAQIPAQASVTQQAIFHTPINKTFLASWLFFTGSGASGGFFSTEATLNLKGYSYSRVTDTRYDIYESQYKVNGAEQVIPSEPFVIGGREVLYFTATTDTNNSEVSCRFSGKLHSN